jgi:hypothetical protein
MRSEECLERRRWQRKGEGGHKQWSALWVVEKETFQVCGWGARVCVRAHSAGARARDLGVGGLAL